MKILGTSVYGIHKKNRNKKILGRLYVNSLLRSFSGTEFMFWKNVFG